MRATIRSSFLTTLLAALATGVDASPAQLDAAGAARLDALRRSPGSAGELIYQGAVYSQRSPDAAPMFRYERRVGATPTGLSSAHITRDTSGQVIIAESAQFTPAYALQRFDAVNRQTGYSGSVIVTNDGRRLEYRLHQNGKVTTASEDVVDPVVTGPSLHGFILQQWDALVAGKTIPVRMVVMAKKQTYGFDIRRVAEADVRTSFSVTPSSLLVRLAVAPLAVVFDSTTKHVVRYEGRVPPMQEVDGKLRELDARVDYTMRAATYR